MDHSIEATEWAAGYEGVLPTDQGTIAATFDLLIPEQHALDGRHAIENLEHGTIVIDGEGTTRIVRLSYGGDPADPDVWLERADGGDAVPHTARSVPKPVTVIGRAR